MSKYFLLMLRLAMTYSIILWKLSEGIAYVDQIIDLKYRMGAKVSNDPVWHRWLQQQISSSG